MVFCLIQSVSLSKQLPPLGYRSLTSSERVLGEVSGVHFKYHLYPIMYLSEEPY